ncbi:MAG TPA: hypothetical protein PLS95_14885, partial [Thermoanaerobaculales bacterium]|nr:hypothetical protein [Thermoanaerobaculales bacterium]
EQVLSRLADTIGADLSQALGDGIEAGVDRGRMVVDGWLRDVEGREIQISFNLEDLRRALREMGLSPDTTGTIP